MTWPDRWSYGQTTTLLQEPNYRHTHIYTNITMIYLPLSHNQKFEVPMKVVLVPQCLKTIIRTSEVVILKISPKYMDIQTCIYLVNFCITSSITLLRSRYFKYDILYFLIRQYTNFLLIL